MELILELKDRIQLLFWFGLANFILAIVLIILSWLVPVEFGGTSAWYKPIKFTLSTAILSFSMGWLTGYLPQTTGIKWFNWIFVISLGFEIIYITFQAAKGQASHYNMSTPLYSSMYTLMAVGATVATLAVAYIGIKFFTTSLPEMPSYLL
ncbi:MAG: hypothetical protein MK078_03810 [Crocinitomicaceae bacterium]|nr:hypothetical protein [Crocinitomicaceae bacterium]